MITDGFVDLQVNGYGGIDFASPDLDLDKIVSLTRKLNNEGTAVFLPTLVSSPPEIYERNLPILAEAIALPEIKDRIPGLHLEGPFISKKSGTRGAHNPLWILPPDIPAFDRLMDLAKGKIEMLTLAAELPGAANLCKHATKLGVAVSLGHQDASANDLQRLVEAGAKSLTHLGNAIPKQIFRHDNPLFAGLANDDLTAMIITDGHHLPLPLLKIMFKTKGIEKIVVVSDSSPVAGLPPGDYEAFGYPVRHEPGGRLSMIETDYLAGSSATMKKCIDYLDSTGLVSGDDLVRVGIRNPLKLIGRSPENI